MRDARADPKSLSPPRGCLFPLQVPRDTDDKSHTGKAALHGGWIPHSFIACVGRGWLEIGPWPLLTLKSVFLPGAGQEMEFMTRMRFLVYFANQGFCDCLWLPLGWPCLQGRSCCSVALEGHLGPCQGPLGPAPGLVCCGLSSWAA